MYRKRDKRRNGIFQQSLLTEYVDLLNCNELLQDLPDLPHFLNKLVNTKSDF